MMASSPTMNNIVGSRNARPLSPEPAEVEHGDDGQDPRGTSARCPAEVDGNAEVSCPTPAAIETATVSV